MGIWPPYACGNDINAIDVNNELSIVATADDKGYLNILNYPSVVKTAPRKTYGGHASFVQNVRFLPRSRPSTHRDIGSGDWREDTLSSTVHQLATVGGDDCSLILWRVLPSPTDEDKVETAARKDFTQAF